MVELVQLTRAEGPEAIREVLDADGGVIVRDFVDPGVLAAFRADMEIAAAGHRAGTVSDDPGVREAGPLGTPWEIAQTLPERAQRLLGWRCSPPKGHAARLWTVDYEDVPVGLGLERGTGADPHR